MERGQGTGHAKHCRLKMNGAGIYLKQSIKEFQAESQHHEPIFFIIMLTPNREGARDEEKLGRS